MVNIIVLSGTLQFCAQHAQSGRQWGRRWECYVLSQRDSDTRPNWFICFDIANTLATKFDESDFSFSCSRDLVQFASTRRHLLVKSTGRPLLTCLCGGSHGYMRVRLVRYMGQSCIACVKLAWDQRGNRPFCRLSASISHCITRSWDWVADFSW